MIINKLYWYSYEDNSILLILLADLHHTESNTDLVFGKFYERLFDYEFTTTKYDNHSVIIKFANDDKFKFVLQFDNEWPIKIEGY